MKSTMMSCPLLINSMLERAGKLFRGVEVVSVELVVQFAHGVAFWANETSCWVLSAELADEPSQ